MFDIAPDHAIGFYAGLLALPLALIAIRLRPGRRRVHRGGVHDHQQRDRPLWRTERGADRRS